MRVNSFSLKQITSFLKVAANKSCGKALSDSGLRLNMSKSRQPETILNMVTIRNLIRLAGTSSPYWSPRIYDQVATWLELCVQNSNQENTGTALQKEDYKTQEPKFNRLKSRKNLRTTGFNLYNSCYKGKRSVHSTLCIKEGTQANEPFVNCCRSLTTTIRFNNLNERVLITKLKHMVEKCKKKDGRYGNIIQIIGSLPIIKLAYLIIKSNLKIYAQGVDIPTLDGINLKDLNKISQDTLSGKFKFSPVRHVFISKLSKTELRFLGVSNLREKIIQKAVEIIITFIFEEFFLDCSHGFRPGHSCHTALKHLQLKAGNASTYFWVIEGDIKECFNNISHDLILKGLKRKIDCPATLILIKRILSAGYILNENLKKVGIKPSKVYKSNTGIPKSIVLSPLFTNIALHELDEFINHELKKEFFINKQQKPNLIYCRLKYRIKRKNDLKKRRVLIKNCRKVYSKNFYDSDYKKLFYVRYADNWVVLIAGSLKDAKIICNKVSDKLQSLGLTLNIKPPHIISLRKGKCRFLGIDFFIRRNTEKHHNLTRLVKKNTTIRQRFAPRIILHAPILELLTKLKDKGFVKRSNHGKFFPKGKSNCIPLTHPQILNYFNNRILGILNYYSCVHNRNELWSIVRFLNYSCALTLARKYKLKSLAKTFKKFGRNLEFVNKKRKKYKIFRPDSLRMLPMNERFRVNENTDIDKLLNQTWSNNLNSISI